MLFDLSLSAVNKINIFSLSERVLSLSYESMAFKNSSLEMVWLLSRSNF